MTASARRNATCAGDGDHVTASARSPGGETRGDADAVRRLEREVEELRHRLQRRAAIEQVKGMLTLTYGPTTTTPSPSWFLCIRTRTSNWGWQRRSFGTRSLRRPGPERGIVVIRRFWTCTSICGTRREPHDVCRRSLHRHGRRRGPHDPNAQVWWWPHRRAVDDEVVMPLDCLRCGSECGPPFVHGARSWAGPAASARRFAYRRCGGRGGVLLLVVDPVTVAP